MSSLSHYVESQASLGRAYLTKEQAIEDLHISPKAFLNAIARLVKKGRLASPRRGFFLILRPEDRIAGAPDPARWIDPFMKHLGIDYRISLLRAAAFHGSSHQAAMVLQIIAPKQIRPIAIGRHKIEFIYQAPDAFKQRTSVARQAED